MRPSTGNRIPPAARGQRRLGLSCASSTCRSRSHDLVACRHDRENPHLLRHEQVPLWGGGDRGGRSLRSAGARRGPPEPGHLHQGPGGARTGVRPGAAALSAPPHDAEERSRPALGASGLGRGNGGNRAPADGVAGASRRGVGSLLPGGVGRQRLGGVRTVADSLRQPVGQSQYGFHGSYLQLAQGQRLPLHLWNGHPQPGLRKHRLHPAVGAQPQRLVADPGHSDLRCPQARRQAHRHRSPGHPPDTKGRPVAQGAARHRRAAGPELPQRDVGGEAVRRGLPSRLDQCPAAGAGRLGRDADSGRGGGRGLAGPLRRMGRVG